MNAQDEMPYRRTLGAKTYFSQAGQDLFVLSMLENKSAGVYCEIGGAHPIESNNTFLLERHHGWRGVSVEFDESLAQVYNQTRSNVCIQADATTLDYAALFKAHNFPTQIDYLSVDIDPASNTFAALSRIPFDHYRFSVITYEHDSHLSGPEFMTRSRDFLRDRGYQLVVQNVLCFGRDFEDWWVDPICIREAVWRPFSARSVEFATVFGESPTPFPQR
jgi:hypothetical protein